MESYPPIEYYPTHAQEVIKLWEVPDEAGEALPAPALDNTLPVIVETQVEGFYSEAATTAQLKWIVFNLQEYDQEYLGSLTKRQAHQIIENHLVRRSPGK